MTKTDTDAALEKLQGLAKANSPCAADCFKADTYVMKIRQALEAQRGGVDVEGLKKRKKVTESGGVGWRGTVIHPLSPEEKGYNQAIDDMNSQGHLSGQLLGNPEWLPIETAPKDGTVFLACKENGHYEQAAFVADRGRFEYWRAPSHRFCATDWQPLPQPPKKGGE